MSIAVACASEHWSEWERFCTCAGVWVSAKGARCSSSCTKNCYGNAPFFGANKGENHSCNPAALESPKAVTPSAAV